MHRALGLKRKLLGLIVTFHRAYKENVRDKSNQTHCFFHFCYRKISHFTFDKIPDSKIHV